MQVEFVPINLITRAAHFSSGCFFEKEIKIHGAGMATFSLRETKRKIRTQPVHPRLAGLKILLWSLYNRY